MHTEAGPLHPSRELLELLRIARASGKKFGAATLSVVAVHAIETEIGAVLPDDALILMALRDRDLRCASGLDINDIPEAHDWDDELPEDRVAIAHVYFDPFAGRDEGAHGGEMQTITIARPGDRARPEIFVDDAATTVAEFVRHHFTEWLRDNDEIISVLMRAKALPLEDESFRPALVGALPAIGAKPTRIVTHAKFGRGVVVEEKLDTGETKLVIDFDSAGRKTLLAKFVTDG